MERILEKIENRQLEVPFASLWQKCQSYLNICLLVCWFVCFGLIVFLKMAGAKALGVAIRTQEFFFFELGDGFKKVVVAPHLGSPSPKRHKLALHKEFECSNDICRLDAILEKQMAFVFRVSTYCGRKGEVLWIFRVRLDGAYSSKWKEHVP